jgi:putative membrane protein
VSPESLLRNLHVLVNLFWIGGIVAVGLVLSAKGAPPKERGALAHFVYRRLAAPAFGISFLLGLGRLALSPAYYFKLTHFMHLKLTLALAVIALHHILGARARRAAAGDATAVEGTGRLVSALALLAVGTAWVALTKPF